MEVLDNNHNGKETEVAQLQVDSENHMEVMAVHKIGMLADNNNGKEVHLKEAAATEVCFLILFAGYKCYVQVMVLHQALMVLQPIGVLQAALAIGVLLKDINNSNRKDNGVSKEDTNNNNSHKDNGQAEIVAIDSYC